MDVTMNQQASQMNIPSHTETGIELQPVSRRRTRRPSGEPLATPLHTGSKLGRYEILASIGAGGMGTVYRARDTQLGRNVAIKVLSPGFARSSERISRLNREAHVMAALNHPNIAAIYGREGRALVMELVEGPTLASIIQDGPVPLEEALRIARQISDALEYAHENGVVHRDLKPANIKLTSSGTVKVLDFGLATVCGGPFAAGDASNFPTMTMDATRAGTILGTVAYMAPEQARGKPVDKRADIWAFGVVFYEMLTGARLFSGETISDTLAAVLTKDPPLGQVPVEARELLRRCLDKDSRRRLRDIGDAWLLLENAQTRPSAISSRRSWLRWNLWD
jgi:serine/threonine protein kinase